MWIQRSKGCTIEYITRSKTLLISDLSHMERNSIVWSNHMGEFFANVFSATGITAYMPL